MIYQINKIGCFSKIADYWDSFEKQNGFDDLYIVNMLAVDGKIYKDKRVATTVDFESSNVFRRIKTGDSGMEIKYFGYK